MFNDHGFRDRVQLSGVNSINWARIMAQIVYYFSSAISLGAPDRPVSFTVPTGNFGAVSYTHLAVYKRQPDWPPVTASIKQEVAIAAIKRPSILRNNMNCTSLSQSSRSISTARQKCD